MRNNDFSSNDLMEIIYKRNDEAIHKIFKNQINAEKILNKYTANIRLDLHGVTDLLNFDEQLIPDDLRETNKITIISYVGKYSDNRLGARKEVKERIKTGQIDFGVLVFRRGRRRDPSRNMFHESGSKAWANQFINTNGPAVFIDDGEDHYESVKSMNIDNLKCILFIERDGPKLMKLFRTEVLGIINKKGGYDNKYKNYKLDIRLSEIGNSDYFYIYLDYIKVHYEEIKEIIHKCFPIYNLDKKSYIDLALFLEKDVHYFVLSNNKVVVVGFVDLKLNYYKSDKNIDTYTLTDIDLKETTDKYSHASLEGLCRNNDPKYKGLGKYLLDKIIEHLKITTYDYLYIVPESVKSKIKSTLNCGITDGYKESQKKLIKYYKKVGFEIVDGLYDKDVCFDENGNKKYVYLNVMKKKIR